MATTTTSGQFTLNLRDFLKGAAVAVFAAVLAFLSPLLEAGDFHIEWKRVGSVALIAFLGYLVKNFVTPPQIVIQDPPKETVQAVKDGKATVSVQPK